MNPTGRLLDTQAAAERLSMHPETVRKMIRRGDLPAVRTQGGRYRVDEAEIIAYIASMEAAA